MRIQLTSRPHSATVSQFVMILCRVIYVHRHYNIILALAHFSYGENAIMLPLVTATARCK